MSTQSRLVHPIKAFMKAKALPASALLLASVLASNPANATILYNDVSSSGVVDGGSIALHGSLNDVSNNARPWLVELYANTGECVRLSISTMTFDAKLTVVAPNGTVYQDHNSGGAMRPRVEIASAPVTGWYTVQVAQQAGAAQVANFELLYGRYYGGNVNCANPTSPL